jgi:outer membrane protein assembly factor BamB
VIIGSTIRHTALALATVGLVTASSGGLLAQSTQLDRGDAAMFRGDATRTGVIAAGNPEGPVALAWQLQVPGPIRSTPVIADGVLYMGSDADGNLFAFDAANGQVLWSSGAPGEIASSPAVTDGVVFFGRDNGVI